MSYAQGTLVSASESQAELRALLTRHGAIEVQVGRNASGSNVVRFRLHGRELRRCLPARSSEQAERANWRAILLLYRAKLEATAAGLSSLDQEFLSDIYIGGATVGQAIGRQLPPRQ